MAAATAAHRRPLRKDLALGDDSALAKLAPIHALFVLEFLKDLNGTQAAIRAGYQASAARNRASSLLARSDVQQAIAEQRKKVIDLSGLSVQRIIQEYMRLAFSNINRFTSVTDDGSDLFSDFSMANEDDFAAIQEVTSEVYLEGRGDDAERVKRTRIKLHEKKGALDSLAKIMGLMKSDDPGAAVADAIRQALGQDAPQQVKAIAFRVKTIKPGDIKPPEPSPEE